MCRRAGPVSAEKENSVSVTMVATSTLLSASTILLLRQRHFRAQQADTETTAVKLVLSAMQPLKIGKSAANWKAVFRHAKGEPSWQAAQTTPR